MCGIAGVAHQDPTRAVDLGQLKRMAAVIRHRGPDDEGYYAAGPVGLAHRRLSIIDLRTGRQPIANEAGSAWIIFSGEIYNHRTLRADLEARGHAYKTHTDTESILHAYEEYGAGCVDRLHGMFAFAIWDGRRRELFLARDRLGIKPLYYAHQADGSLYFASEIKALLAGGAIRPEINAAALPEYLANRTTSGDDTLFRGVKRLPAGHTLCWRDGQVRTEQYWDVSFGSGGDGREEPAPSVPEWSRLFEEAVRSHLLSDVPVGVFLSGGIDSSAIAAVMRRLVDGPMRTFSVAFEAREANELEYARLVARACRSEHHEVVVTPEQFFGALPKLVWHEDEPMAGPASVPLYFVSELAAQHVKVVLTGEGSDELLGGYDRYRKTVANVALGTGYHRLTHPAIRAGICRRIDRLGAASRLRQKLGRTFIYLPTDLDCIYFDNFAVFRRAAQDELLTSAAIEQIGAPDPYRNVRECWRRSDANSVLNRLLYADTKVYLQELLMKQDQMSMAASLESRVPFLDHPLVEFTTRLPERWKMRRWQTKYVLRRSMEGVLPDVILHRPKLGFPVPLASWLRGPCRWVLDEYVLSPRASGRGWFNPAAVSRLVQEHQSGSWNHADRLWSLINLEIWFRQFIDGESAGRPPFSAAPVATVLS